METIKVSRWVRPKRFGRLVACFLFSAACLVTGTTFALLTDTGEHLPPTTGTFHYNTFTPSLPGVPGIGGTYVDPVFGSVVRRLTNIGASVNQDFNYTFHYLNADGTLSFNHTTVDIDILSTANGSVVYSAQPDGSDRNEARWDMLDPDKYYFLSGASLMRRNLALQSNTTMKTFPATLQTQGGSVNFQSADGRYFVVKYNNTHHVWDSQTDTIYSGNIPTPDSAGFVGITPSGKYVWGGNYLGSPDGDIFYSFAINHGTQSVNTTGAQTWRLCGAHSAVVSASDGNDYLVTFNCNDESAAYAITIGPDRAGLTKDQMKAAGTKLMDLDFSDGGHASGVSVGANRDWVFIGIESVDDNYNVTPTAGNWRPFKQEIVAANVRTGELRRLAHHRSRGLPGNYQEQPKVSTSPTGNIVLWSSNMNDSSPAGYADLYVIQSPLGPGSGQIPAPTSLRFK
jgi:hypothetical protein